MLELVVFACLHSDHAKCKEVSLTYLSETTTPMQCMMSSAPEIAKWAEHHPRWFAKKWACRPAGRFAKI
jgi:hypothetical protein